MKYAVVWNHLPNDLNALAAGVEDAHYYIDLKKASSFDGMVIFDQAGPTTVEM